MAYDEDDFYDAINENFDTIFDDNNQLRAELTRQETEIESLKTQVTDLMKLVNELRSWQQKPDYEKEQNSTETRFSNLDI
jgi:hypothetical protein